MNGLTVGQRWAAPSGVPAFGGVAEYYTENPYDALLRLDEPGPGIAALGAQLYFWGRVAFLPVYAFGIPVVRTLVWTVALAGIVLVLAACLPI